MFELQPIRADGRVGLACRSHARVIIIRDVEGGAVEMATVVLGIGVATAETLYVIKGAERTAHLDLVQRKSFADERILKISGYDVEQAVGTGDEIRHRARHGAQIEERRSADIHEFAGKGIGLFLRLERARQTEAGGRGKLDVILVGEGFLVAWHAQDGMLHRVSLGIGGRRKGVGSAKKAIHANGVAQYGVGGESQRRKRGLRAMALPRSDGTHYAACHDEGNGERNETHAAPKNLALSFVGCTHAELRVNRGAKLIKKNYMAKPGGEIFF